MLQRCVAMMVLLFVGFGCTGGGGEAPARSAADQPVEQSGPVLAAPEPLPPAAWSPPNADPNFELFTDPGELPYLALADDSGRSGAGSDSAARLPLTHTHVNATLNGMLAEVEVTQTYKNSAKDAVEAVYTFPLPENSAVNFMQMVIGKRTITAEIDERGRARRRYEAARHGGFTAALLESERPNVFTQSVANIPPGESIDVVVRYVQDLSYDRGQYEFVFPMVVGPRFMPGGSLGTRTGAGTHADTERVPDASRISPPYMGEGERSGHDISIEVVARAAEPIAHFQAVTHRVSAREPADGSLRLTLAEAAALPNRDFVLRYSTVGAEPQAALYTSPAGGAGGGYFSLVVEPPALDVEALVGRRELIFVVDVSGSMAGTPLGLCRTAMRRALEGLRPQDTFNIITFAGHTTQAFEKPRPANRSNVTEALRVVDEMQAGGGTHMANAIDAALGPAVAQGRHRYVFFMTDGYVGNEAEILERSDRFVRDHESQGVRAKVFGFGVGSSPNRYLVSGLGKVGKGLSVYANTREDPARAVNQFYHYIDRAILTNVRIDWGGLTARDVYPSEAPDLFASHPLVLHGRYQGAATRPIRLLAKTSEGNVEVPIAVREAETQGKPSQALGSLWARAKIDDLEEGLLDGSQPDARARITELGLSHRLVTRFTSFVAIDSSRRVGSGDPRQVVQPAERPEGVDVTRAGGKVLISEDVEVVELSEKDRKKERKDVAASAAAEEPAPREPEARKPEPPPPPPTQAPAPVTAAPSDGDDHGYGYDDAESGAELEAAPAEEAEEYQEAPVNYSAAREEVEPKRGCGCRMVGSATSGGLPLALGLGLAGLWCVRRRRQRAAVELRRQG